MERHIKRDEIYCKKTFSNFYQSRLDTQITINFFSHFFKLSIRMTNNKTINFDDKKISKSNFYKNKKLFNIYDLDVNKILISKKESYGTKNSLKYFIGYNYDDAIRSVCIKLPQMIGYVKHFDGNKTMSFKVGDNKLLKKCNKIWEKISNLNIEFDRDHVYHDNDKYIKTKIKMYDDRVNTNFQGKKVPEENASYKCLSLIMLGSVIRVNKKYYPQTLLEECKYVIRKNKMENLINDDLDQSSYDESDNETDNESDSEIDSDESSD